MNWCGKWQTFQLSEPQFSYLKKKREGEGGGDKF